MGDGHDENKMMGRNGFLAQSRHPWSHSMHGRAPFNFVIRSNIGRPTEEEARAEPGRGTVFLPAFLTSTLAAAYAGDRHVACLNSEGHCDRGRKPCWAKSVTTSPEIFFENSADATRIFTTT